MIKHLSLIILFFTPIARPEDAQNECPSSSQKKYTAKRLGFCIIASGCFSFCLGLLVHSSVSQQPEHTNEPIADTPKMENLNKTSNAPIDKAMQPASIDSLHTHPITNIEIPKIEPLLPTEAPTSQADKPKLAVPTQRSREKTPVIRQKERSKKAEDMHYQRRRANLPRQH